MHISQLIEQASAAAIDVKVVYQRTIMDLMMRDDFSHEQKLAIIELLNPLAGSIDKSIAQFLVEGK